MLILLGLLSFVRVEIEGREIELSLPQIEELIRQIPQEWGESEEVAV